MTSVDHDIDERSTDAELSFGWLWHTIGRYKGLYAQIVALAVFARLMALVEPFIFQIVIDRILPFGTMSSLYAVIFVFIGVSLFQVLFELIGGLLSAIASNHVVRGLAYRLFDHLLDLPYASLRTWSVGGTIMRIREIDTVKDFLVERATTTLIDLIFVFVYLALLFTLSPQLTVVVLIGLPIQIALFFAFGPPLRRRLQDRFTAASAYQSRVIESIGGFQTIKALSAETEIARSIKGRLRRYLDQDFRVNALSVINEKLIFVVERSLTIAILLLGTGYVASGDLTLGELVAFYLLADKIAEPLSQSSSLWEAWQNLRLSRRRLNDIIASPAESAPNQSNLPETVSAQLSLDGVCFDYGDTPVLRDLSFEFPVNALSLIVGPSGAGKSTIGRLAVGLERPSQGTVRLGGEAIDLYTPASVRQRLVYVPQDTNLFRGSIAENFRLVRPEATDAEIWAALEHAGAVEFLLARETRLETWVDERGGTLSGGQRQRIALARALITNPKVLILDEPTSALDSQTETRVAATLTALAKDRTVIVITHRPEVFPAVSTTLELDGGAGQ